MDQLFSQLSESKTKVKPKTKFAIMDLVDLRKVIFYIDKIVYSF